MKDYQKPSITEVKLLKEDIMDNSLLIDDSGVEDFDDEEEP